LRWEKKGLLVEPVGTLEWMASHAAMPVAQPLDDATVRIYCSGRDAQGRAQIGACTVDLARPERGVRFEAKPVLRVGPLGAFDDRGTTSSWLVVDDERQYLYYTGWSLGVTVPFYLYVGLAISNDGGQTFTKVSSAPILDRNATDPFLTASPCVLIDNGTWRMWYVSGVRWEQCSNAVRHYYHVRYAESEDGVHWQRTGQVCIDFKDDTEYAISRPCVRYEDGRYHMWYSYRGAAYRIGYAESRDGLVWERQDARAGIEPSAAGWDAEMVAYPYVFAHGRQMYMLYNGNGYGRTGIGLAVRAREAE
jgi:hypothetical protein